MVEVSEKTATKEGELGGRAWWTPRPRGPPAGGQRRALSLSLPPSSWTPRRRDFTAALTEGTLKEKMEARFFVLHYIEHNYSPSSIFFLLKRFLVFNLSLRSSQKKNLCLPKLLEAQSQENSGEASICPISKL